MKIGVSRVGRSRKDIIVYIGPFACRYTLYVKPTGRFSNGSSWRSGWHNWRKEPVL